MKPVKLKFKGINSFSEETEIDFDKLIRGGISEFSAIPAAGKALYSTVSILRCTDAWNAVRKSLISLITVATVRKSNLNLTY